MRDAPGRSAIAAEFQLGRRNARAAEIVRNLNALEKPRDFRDREERRGEALRDGGAALDCVALLAMTVCSRPRLRGDRGALAISFGNRR
jgi:hypothetical protein